MFGFFKRRKPFVYKNIEPPFFKPHMEMTEAEAQRHFEWFIGQSENRRKHLLDMIKATGGRFAECDFSRESLIPLWVSASRFFEERPLTEQEDEALFEKVPAAARDIGIPTGQLTISTGCLAMDIGFYFAEVFMRQHPKVRWALWRDEEGPYNREYLVGFTLPLVPMDLVTSCIWDQLDKPKTTWLVEAYMHWEKNNLLPDFKSH